VLLWWIGGTFLDSALQSYVDWLPGEFKSSCTLLFIRRHSLSDDLFPLYRESLRRGEKGVGKPEFTYCKFSTSLPPRAKRIQQNIVNRGGHNDPRDVPPLSVQ